MYLNCKLFQLEKIVNTITKILKDNESKIIKTLVSNKYFSKYEILK